MVCALALHRRARALALVVGLLVPAIGRAVPVLVPYNNGYSTVVGWSNSSGDFAVDFASGIAIDGGGEKVSYSTASSLYALQGPDIQVIRGGAQIDHVPADMRIDAIIQGNGTISGNLLAGALTIIAGADGIPTMGIAPGQTLVVGQAIDAAALPGSYDTEFLFKLIYTNPLLPGLGDYLTYFNPDSGSWGDNLPGGVPFNPGARILPADSGFDLWDLPTNKIPEPSSLVLVAMAFVAIGFARSLDRRRKR